MGIHTKVSALLALKDGKAPVSSLTPEPVRTVGFSFGRGSSGGGGGGGGGGGRGVTTPRSATTQRHASFNSVKRSRPAYNRSKTVDLSESRVNRPLLTPN